MKLRFPVNREAEEDGNQGQSIAQIESNIMDAGSKRLERRLKERKEKQDTHT